MKKVNGHSSSEILRDYRTGFLKRSEKYINFVRVILLTILTALFLLRAAMSAPYFRSDIFWAHLVGIGLSWFIAIGVAFHVRAGSMPWWMPWLTGVTDLALITNGLITSSFTVEVRFPTDSIITSSYYGLYYLIILFSVMRLNPAQSIIIAVSSAIIYGYSAFALGYSDEPPLIFGFNEGLKVLFLLMAGGFSALVSRFTARSVEAMSESKARAYQSDQRIAHLASHLPGVVMQFRRDKNKNYFFSYASDGLQRILGEESLRLFSRPKALPLYFDTPSKRRILAYISQDFDQTVSETLELCMNPLPWHPQEIWFRVGVTALPEDNGAVIFNALVLDITDQMRNQAQLEETRRLAEQASAAKSSFLANMSHELRTPLNAILGLSEWLLSFKTMPDPKGPLKTIHRAAEGLLELISDMLDISRLEAGKLPVAKRGFVVGDLVDELRAMFTHRAAEKNLDLKINLAPDFPKSLVTDPSRVRQILVNLLENAIKYTLSGWVQLNIKTRGSAAVFEVEDTGIGIPEKDRDRIFETFTQVDNTKTRIFGGSGLGLAISRRLAVLLDGSLTLESRPGDGSLFTLQIPLVVDQRQAPRTAPAESGKDLRPLEILLVDDNEVNQDVQSRMLQRLGMKVRAVSNGLAALEVLKEKTYDLVFIDWQMPVIDGIETARRIRREVPGGDQIPLVALSGHAFPSDRMELLSAGFTDYLAKPVRMGDFRRVLEDLSSKSVPS